MDIEAVACVHNLQYKFSTRVSKILWSMVSKAADRSRRQRQKFYVSVIKVIMFMYVLYIGEQFQWSDVYSKQAGEDLSGC